MGCFLIGNNFTKNVADRDGGAIKYTSQAPIDLKNFFSGNAAVYGNDSASYPVRMIPVNGLSKVAKVNGQGIAENLEFEVVVKVGERVETLNKGYSIAKYDYKFQKKKE